MSIRQWGTEGTGPWAMLYDAGGSSGIMLDRNESGWALSGAFRGRGLVVGWAYLGKKPFQWKLGE